MDIFFNRCFSLFQFENLSADFEKLQFNYGKLQKKIDALEEDKKAVELEIQRILKDKNITELNLRYVFFQQTKLQ